MDRRKSITIFFVKEKYLLSFLLYYFLLSEFVFVRPKQCLEVRCARVKAYECDCRKVGTGVVGQLMPDGELLERRSERGVARLRMSRMERGDLDVEWAEWNRGIVGMMDEEFYRHLDDDADIHMNMNF